MYTHKFNNLETNEQSSTDYRIETFKKFIEVSKLWFLCKMVELLWGVNAHEILSCYYYYYHHQDDTRKKSCDSQSATVGGGWFDKPLSLDPDLAQSYLFILKILLLTREYLLLLCAFKSWLIIINKLFW